MEATQQKAALLVHQGEFTVYVLASINSMVRHVENGKAMPMVSVCLVKLH